MSGSQSRPKPYDFRARGQWNEGTNAGTISKAPEWTKQFTVESITALWLPTGDYSVTTLNKNHMRWHLNLITSERMTVRDVVFDIKGIQISLETVDPSTIEEDDYVKGVPGVCGADYELAQCFLKVVSFKAQDAKAVAYQRRYPVKAGSNAGQFINSILGRNLDKAFYHKYTHRGVKMGCGHFVLNAYQAWIIDGLITNSLSVESPRNTLAEDIGGTHFQDGRVVRIPVGRGGFPELRDKALMYPSKLVPKETWSDIPSRVDLISQGVNLADYYTEEANVAEAAAQAARARSNRNASRRG